MLSSPISTAYSFIFPLTTFSQAQKSLWWAISWDNFLMSYFGNQLLFVWKKVCFKLDCTMSCLSSSIGQSSVRLPSKLDSDELYCVTKISHILLIRPFFVRFSFSPMKIWQLFFCQRFLSNYSTWLRILKLGTKLDSDEFYCVTKTVRYCLSFSLFIHFSFSPMKISVTDFSVPIVASDSKILCTISV